MLLRFDAVYSGAKFSEIADEAILLDIIEQPAEVDVQTSRLAGGPGMMVSSVTRTALSVQLVYIIRTQDPVRRMEVQRMVAKWANAGFNPNNSQSLEVSTRPGMRLEAKAYNSPVQNSALRWTDELSVTFVAYDIPYWIGETVSVSVNTSWQEGYRKYRGANVIKPAGDVTKELVSTVSVINTDPESDWLTWLRVKIDDTEITFDGIGIPINKMMIITYVQPRILKAYNIFNSTENLIKYRTPDSNDDLVARVGVNNQIIIEADAQVSASVAVDGWWL